jgi:hypothetical protein
VLDNVAYERPVFDRLYARTMPRSASKRQGKATDEMKPRLALKTYSTDPATIPVKMHTILTYCAARMTVDMKPAAHS